MYILLHFRFSDLKAILSEVMGCWRLYKDSTLSALAVATALGMVFVQFGHIDSSPTSESCLPFQENASSFDDFSSFYPFYLCQHRKPLTKLFHFVATFNTIVLTAYGFSHRPFKWWVAVFGFVQAYALAWVSHFWIEDNKPATFRYPLYSLVGDFKMFSDYLMLKFPPYWS